MNKLIYVALLLLSMTGFAQAQKTNKVKIEYQKRQKIDLGALTIEGQIVAPSDFSIDDEKQRPSSKLYRRTNYDDRVKMSIDEVM